MGLSIVSRRIFRTAMDLSLFLGERTKDPVDVLKGYTQLNPNVLFYYVFKFP